MAATWRQHFSDSNFFRISLKPGIYRFSGSASLLALSVFICDPNRGYSGHFDFIIDLLLSCDYWHNVLEAVVSDLWIFSVTASAEGCFSA